MLETIIHTELALRLRNPVQPVLIAFLLAACALLVPNPGANYTVITLDGKKPLMSADTALVAAAVVFGALLLPVYSLALDMGHARDRRHFLDRLHLTTPIEGAVLSAGRLLAGLIFVLLTALLSLLVVLSTVLARYDGLASPSAVALFLLVVVPVGFFATLVAAALDRLLPDQNGARTALAFAIWLAAIGVSIAAWWDLFGISYLAEATSSEGHTPVLSVGVIAARDMPETPWISAPLTSIFVSVRLSLILALMATTAVLSFFLRTSLQPTPSVVESWIGAASPGETRCARPTQLTPVVTPTASVRVAACAVAWRLFGRSRLLWALMTLSLVLALSTSTPGAALAVALMVVMVAVSQTSAREARVAATLEMTTAALFRPSPSLLHGGVLAMLAALPTLPAFARMAPVQAATAVLGIFASALWLTWTHRCVQRPLFGISTFALLWYMDTFNDVPPALDILGLWSASTTALLATAAAVGGMIFLVGRHDRQGGSWIHGAV